MSQIMRGMYILVERSQCDRRTPVSSAPPYLTEEGMVLVDRRESLERRCTQSWQVEQRIAMRKAAA
jgi:hypothetical protein